MRTYNIHHSDAFTSELFGGNPTVTVLNADSLTDIEMRKIAREMNMSETGFILSSSKADFRLRFFTPPGDEIKFCGHATVGALCAISYDKLFGCNKPQNNISVETNAGILPVTIDLQNPETPKFIFDAPKTDLVIAPYDLEEAAKSLGLLKDQVDWTEPLMLDKNNNYLYFAVPSLALLGQINLDIRGTLEFAKKYGIIVFCALTAETFDASHHIHTRGFAPLVGVNEDPFTGSMQAGAADYAFRQGLLNSNQNSIGIEQGHFLQRPGHVQLEVKQKEPLQVRLHASAVHVYSAKLTLR